MRGSDQKKVEQQLQTQDSLVASALKALATISQEKDRAGQEAVVSSGQLERKVPEVARQEVAVDQHEAAVDPQGMARLIQVQQPSSDHGSPAPPVLETQEPAAERYRIQRLELSLHQAMLKLKIPQRMITKPLVEIDGLLKHFLQQRTMSCIADSFGLTGEIRSAFIEALCSYEVQEKVRRIEERMGEGDLYVISAGSKLYPQSFLHLSSPPPFLYIYTQKQKRLRWLNEQNKVTVIGTRKPSPYGRRVTELMTADWASRGVTIVSGMARGIDGLSHQAALSRGGKTIAILGCGPDVLYPRENKAIFLQIREQGLILSEYPPGTHPLPQFFPARNRLLSALSSALVVIEATRKSGTMITTDFALDQGIPVLAVPGSVFSPCSHGTNQLLRDGAAVLLEPEDLFPYLDLDLLEEPQHQDTSSSNKGMADEAKDGPTSSMKAIAPAQKILDLLRQQPLNIDMLRELSQLSPGELYCELIRLEGMGRLEKHAGVYHFVS